MNKKIVELTKQNKIKDCKINTYMRMGSINPLTSANEELKKALQEEEKENRKLQEDIKRLSVKIEEIKLRDCTNCTKLNEDLLRLTRKYDDIKKLCRIRNERVNELEQICAQKENESQNSRNVNTNISNTLEVERKSLTESLEQLQQQHETLKLKYEKMKYVAIARKMTVDKLEAQIKNE